MHGFSFWQKKNLIIFWNHLFATATITNCTKLSITSITSTLCRDFWYFHSTRATIKTKFLRNKKTNVLIQVVSWAGRIGLTESNWKRSKEWGERERENAKMASGAREWGNIRPWLKTTTTAWHQFDLVPLSGSALNVWKLCELGKDVAGGFCRSVDSSINSRSRLMTPLHVSVLSFGGLCQLHN